MAYLDKAIKFSPVYVISLLLICFIFKLYQSIWEYAGFLEFSRIIATSLLWQASMAGTYFLSLMIPRSCYFIAAFLLLFYLCLTPSAIKLFGR